MGNRPCFGTGVVGWLVHSGTYNLEKEPAVTSSVVYRPASQLYVRPGSVWRIFPPCEHGDVLNALTGTDRTHCRLTKYSRDSTSALKNTRPLSQLARQWENTLASVFDVTHDYLALG